MNRPLRRLLPVLLLTTACASTAAVGGSVRVTEPDEPQPAATTTATVPAATTTTVPPEPAPVPSRGGDRAGLDFGTTEPPIDASLFVEYRARVEPLAGTVALTFDDGPDPTWTPIILDILREKGVAATFFVLGWKVDAHPEIARRIVEEGHSLQSHSYRHHNLTNRSVSAVAWQIDETSRAIRDATGTTPTCIRPPRGISNDRLVATAAEHGHQVVLWTPAGNTGDYSHGSRSVVLSRSRAWEPGYVTLMHDTWGWLYRDALGQMIDEMRERGIGFSTICVLEEVPETLRTW